MCGVGPGRGDDMTRRRHTPEPIITRLPEAEVGLVQGRSVAQVKKAQTDAG